MISITAEYALRAVVFLARGPQQAWTTKEVADATRISVSYLSKVLQALVRAEIVRSVRGIYGGYQMDASPAELTVLDIINSVDPIRRIRQCPLGLDEHHTRLCPLHRRLDETIAQSERALAETSVAELLAELGNPSACRFPAVPPSGAAGRKRSGSRTRPQSQGVRKSTRARAER